MWKCAGNTLFPIVLWIRIHMDPHHFGKLDLDPDPVPHQSGKLDPEPDPHKSEKHNPDQGPHQSERRKPIEGHVGALEGQNLEKSEW